MTQGEILTIFCIALVVVFLAQIVEPGRRRIAKLIGLALVLLALGGYVAYRHREETAKALERARRRAEFKSRISQFAESHNAVQDWQQPFKSKVKVYSAELTPVLVRQDGRPILSFVMVEDVKTIGGQYIIGFTNPLKPHLKLRLDCTPEQAHLAMSDPLRPTFAVIAQIESVDLLDQTGGGDTEDSSFQATGRCVDVMQLDLGDWFGFAMPESSR